MEGPTYYKTGTFRDGMLTLASVVKCLLVIVASAILLWRYGELALGAVLIAGEAVFEFISTNALTIIAIASVVVAVALMRLVRAIRREHQ